MGWNPVADIRGPQGVQGIQGVQGSPGVKGDTGAKGDKGDPYTTVVVTPAGSTGAYTLSPNDGTDWYLTATGNRTITVASGGFDGKMILIDILASGAERSITVNGVTQTAGMVNPLPIPSGKVGTIGIRRTNGVWRMLAQTVDS